MRQVICILEVITAAAGAFTSGPIDVSGFDAVEVYFKATGAAAAAVAAVDIYAEDGATICHTDNAVVGIGGSGVIGYGNAALNPSTSDTANGPVPRLVAIKGTGGAASTVTIKAMGIRREAQIRG